MGHSIKEEISLAEARWVLYTKLQNSDKLPPTADVLKFKIFAFEKHHPARSCILWLGESRWSLHSSDDR